MHLKKVCGKMSSHTQYYQRCIQSGHLGARVQRDVNNLENDVAKRKPNVGGVISKKKENANRKAHVQNDQRENMLNY